MAANTLPPNKKRRLILFLILLVPMFSCVLWIGIPTHQNNQRLHEFGQSLFKYPLPPDTVEGDRFSAISPPPGNGDKCYFTAEVVLTSKLSKEQIQAYYKDVTFPELRDKTAIVHKPISPELFFNEDVPDKRWIEFIIRIQDNENDFMADLRCW